MNIRVGFGFDVHQLTEGRDLWLGGVKIEHPKGALGHSDADVLLHAICDALLGAANMRDIGYHFPTRKANSKTSTPRFSYNAQCSCLAMQVGISATSIVRWFWKSRRLCLM